MYIKLERDYNANDNKGLYVHFHEEAGHGEEGTALIRIENGFMVWYESQNGEYMSDHNDTRRRIGNGDYMNDENIDIVCQWLSRQFSEAEIDKTELSFDV